MSSKVIHCPHPEEPRSGVSKDGRIGIAASWFETALARLLTMRITVNAPR
jgi:hypothetical protein